MPGEVARARAPLLPRVPEREPHPAAHRDRERDVRGGDRGRRGTRLLTLVGLASKLDHLPDELSGGEAQRTAIARSLAQQPDALLCDEPTGHLDSDTSSRVLDLIDALRADFGFALVMATHDPEVAARCDRIVEINDGRISDTPPSR